MFERFTDRARKVMALANQEAQRFNHEYIGTEHILLGLVKEGSGVGASVLRRMGVDLRKVRLEVEKLVKSGPDVVTMGKLPQTPRARKVLELAMEEAKELNHNYVGTEHLLLGLLREPEGIASQVLKNLGLNLEEVREEVLNLLGAGVEGDDQSPPSASPGDTATGMTSPVLPDAPGAGGQAGGGKQQAGKSKTPALDAFGRDLTELAREGKLDPVIGRENEIERMVQILCRRTKNNPVLLGEAGVGKTAIVEGLARKVIAHDVPEILAEQRIVVLDVPLMVAGTKYRGQFEERIKAVMAEVKKNRNILLFVDELHTLIGAGGAEGALDASNVLKPALSRGEIQCVGATTLDEYRKYIEKDSALERRFQTIVVNPPSAADTVKILEGLRPKYEQHHKVKITDGALKFAVDLSERYISSRVQPDKSIDVIDEAGARIRLRGMSKPPNLSDVEAQIEHLAVQKDEAVKASDYEKAAELRDAAEQLKKQKEDAQKAWREKATAQAGTVDEEVVAEVVSKMTGIPLTRIEKAETQRLMQLEGELHKAVVSQDEAVKAVARAVRRARAGLKDPRRPVGSFIFLGPSGVGKTLLSKALAEFMFGDPDSLIRIDMSEYMEKHTSSRLVGSPPGYVGYEEGGQLTEQIRRRPYSVVLFDEVEKAHPDVFNMLLQVMEEGQLTDSFGRHVDFRNTVLILTSNIGAELIKNKTSFGFAAHDEVANYEKIKTLLQSEVQRHFRPEFINRLDDVIVFKPLERKDLDQIIEYELGKVFKRLKDRDITLDLDASAKAFLIDKGYNPDMGARPLRRALEQQLEDPLSDMLLLGELPDHCVVRISKPEGADAKLAFVVEKKPEEHANPAAPAENAPAAPVGAE